MFDQAPKPNLSPVATRALATLPQGTSLTALSHDETHQALTQYVDKAPGFFDWATSRLGAKNGATPFPKDLKSFEALRQSLKAQDLSDRSAAALVIKGQLPEGIKPVPTHPLHFTNPTNLTILGTAGLTLPLAYSGALELIFLAPTALSLVSFAASYFALVTGFSEESINKFAGTAWVFTLLNLAQVGAYYAALGLGASPNLAPLLSLVVPILTLLPTAVAIGSEKRQAFNQTKVLVDHHRGLKNTLVAYESSRENLITDYFRYRPSDYLEFIKNFLPEYLKKQRATAEAKREEHQKTIRDLERARDKNNPENFPSETQRQLIADKIEQEIERYEKLVQQMDETVLAPMDRALKETLPKMQGELENLITDLNKETGRTQNQNEVLSLLKKVSDGAGIEAALIEDQAQRMREFETRLDSFFNEIRATQNALTEVDRSLARFQLTG